MPVFLGLSNFSKDIGMVWVSGTNSFMQFHKQYKWQYL